MFLKKCFTLIFICIGVTSLSAQSIRGTVTDGISGQPLQAVTVYNMDNRQYAYTDVQGMFQLSGRKGERVRFSSPGYHTQLKTIPSSLGVASMFIELFPLTYELEEFIYRPRYTPYQLDSMERSSTYQRALAREHGGSFMSPVTFLAEKLSSKSRSIFRFQKSFNYWETEKFVESRYSPELVQKLTSLQGDTIAYFMNACPMPYDFARAASDLEIKIWIREHFRKWQKNPVYPHGLPLADSVLKR